jgi:hypothetical protein
MTLYVCLHMDIGFFYAAVVAYSVSLAQNALFITREISQGLVPGTGIATFISKLQEFFAFLSTGYQLMSL